MLNIGYRIKKRREFLGITTGDLANAIDASSSLISQIERSKAFPSILTLKKIADTLKTTVGELIGENETIISNPLLKASDRKFVKENEVGTKLYLLSRHNPKKEMDIFLIEFVVNSDSRGIMTTKHPRHEFCYVLKGKFKTMYNSKEYTLEEGDSFYFTSDFNHSFVNISKGEAQLIWVVKH